jgi:hypothetical protein
MDRDQLLMLMEYILNRQTTGDQSIGADDPYDDYGMQNTIGGLGATDGNTYPYEDWDDTGIAEPGSGLVSYGSGQVGGRAPWRDVPLLPAPEGPGRRPTLEEILDRLPEQKARRSAERKPWEDRGFGGEYYDNVEKYLAEQPTTGDQSIGGDANVGGYIDPAHPDWYGGYRSMGNTPIGDAPFWDYPPDGYWQPAMGGAGTSITANQGGYNQSDTVDEELVAAMLAELGQPVVDANTSSGSSIGGDPAYTGMDPQYPGDTYIPTFGRPTGGGRSSWPQGRVGDMIADSDEDSEMGPGASTGDELRHWTGPFWPGTIYAEKPAGYPVNPKPINPVIDTDPLNELARALANAQRQREEGAAPHNLSPDTGGPPIQRSSDVSRLYQMPFGGNRRIPHEVIPIRRTEEPAAPPSRYGSGFPGQQQQPASMNGLFGNPEPVRPAPEKAMRAAPPPANVLQAVRRVAQAAYSAPAPRSAPAPVFSAPAPRYAAPAPAPVNRAASSNLSKLRSLTGR